MAETKLHSDLFSSPAILPGGLTIGTGNIAITSGNVTTASGNITTAAGSAGIGTASPNAVAALEMVSTTKGFLPPRMTTAQRTAITGVPGLMVFDTDLGVLFTWV